MSKVAILGSGSWATALAKIVLNQEDQISWYIRRQDTINKFITSGRNPNYLCNAQFDVSHIHFSTDINKVVSAADVLILAIPSPYVRQTLTKIRRSMRNKVVISAVKGMIPEENVLVTDFMRLRFNMSNSQMAIVTGPCHAEEIAMEKLSYLTIGCTSQQRADELCTLLSAPYVHTSSSSDIDELEYSSVLKNIYAIAAGLCHSLRYGDNFQSVLISNAMQEIQRFIVAMKGSTKNIVTSGYLGDVLVTAYSQYSRNRQFGQMVGMGYSVKAAQREMQMVAEGFYGTKCIHSLNQHLHLDLPIVDAVYSILYERQSPQIIISELTNLLK